MALSSSQIWEVRSGGHNDNGGGFDASVVSPGTDRSQQDSPHVTFDGATVDATTGGVSDTITITGHTVAAADVGNTLKVTGGTNFTTGYYTIIAVNTGSGTWQLDRNCTTGAGSAMTGRMGGAIATIGQATNAAVPANVRQDVYVKATATYTITATINQPNSTFVRVIGYTTTRGDGGTVSVACSTDSVVMVTVGVGSYYWENFTFTHSASTRGMGFSQNGIFSDFGPVYLVNCTITGCQIALDGATFNKIVYYLTNCVISNSVSHGMQTGMGQIVAVDTLFLSNGGSGVNIHNDRTDTTSLNVFVRCVFAGNTGAGFKTVSQPTYGANWFLNCSFYSNGDSGIKLDVAAAIAATVLNCIFVSNTGYGINVAQTNSYAPSDCQGIGNAYYNNSSGQVQRFPNVSAVSLSGDPFTNAGSQDYTLDNTASEGAACRAASLPGTKRAGGTQYLDLGAFQTQGSGGGGGGGVRVGGYAGNTGGFTG